MNTGEFEVRISGLPGNDQIELQRKLATFLGGMKDDTGEPRFEGRIAIVPFKTHEKAVVFTQSHNNLPFIGGTIIRVEYPAGAGPKQSLRPLRPPVLPVAPPVAATGLRATALPLRSAPASLAPHVLPDKTESAPYHFVPVAMPHALTAEPVWHDRIYPDRVSGELQLSFKALTPLLAGNDQYPIAARVSLDLKLNSEQRGRLEKAAEQLNGTVGIPTEKLRLDKDGNFTCYGPLSNSEWARLRAYLSQEVPGLAWDHVVARLCQAAGRVNEQLVVALRKLFDQRDEAARNARGGLSSMQELKPDKPVIEPLALPRSGNQTIGPVLVAGAALDGMLRHSYSALLWRQWNACANERFPIAPT